MGTVRKGTTTRWRYARAWFRDGKPLWWWLVVFGILVAIPCALAIGEPRERILWSGILLQLVGLGTVVWGMDESRKLFESPPIWKAAVQWLARARYIIVPPPPQHVIIEAGSGSYELTGSAAAVSVSWHSLEDRVAALETGLTKVKENVAQVDQRVTELRNEAGKRLDRERADRLAGDQKLETQLNTAIIGGIQLELSGVFYLGFGIVFASAPETVARLLERIGL